VSRSTYESFAEILDTETVHSVIQRRASESPSRFAVRDALRQLTYAELDSRSRQIAEHLIGVGVLPGDWVGICLDRSVDMVAGLLGVLRAGAAYVPLDPDFPRGRLEFMAEDAGLRTLLTESSLRDSIASVERVVLLEEVRTDGSTRAALPTVPPDALAYVIYTSGSTGRPRGVKIAHRSVVNLLLSIGEEPGIGPEDLWLAVTTLSFDISVLELLGPLFRGATTCIASRDEVLDGTKIRAALERSGATIMQATPVMWRLVLEAGWQGAAGFRALCGGEALPPDLAEDLLPKVGSLWNMYGPTETTIWSTCHRIQRGTPILIGRPVANTAVYVLDPRGRLLPPGVPGELYIGGVGVGVGYHARGDLDAERFLTDPFASQPASRMYRTGDLGRYLRDGTIEHRGRGDDQVKIRGFRVELGEIEASLARVDGIERAAVGVKRGAGGDDRLIAFYVSDQPSVVPEKIRASLGDELPRYMIPHHFVQVGAFPTTPNGKVDRMALVERFADLPRAPRPFVAPRSESEEAVAAAIAEVLALDRVSADADFFDLGGHSVLGMRLVALLRERVSREVSLRDLFERPGVWELAGRIDELTGRGGAETGDAELEEVVF
jgi:amino acid adenylation domain-containing protein